MVKKIRTRVVLRQTDPTHGLVEGIIAYGLIHGFAGDEIARIMFDMEIRRQDGQPYPNKFVTDRATVVWGGKRRKTTKEQIWKETPQAIKNQIVQVFSTKKPRAHTISVPLIKPAHQLVLPVKSPSLDEILGETEKVMNKMRLLSPRSLTDAAKKRLMEAASVSSAILDEIWGTKSSHAPSAVL